MAGVLGRELGRGGFEVRFCVSRFIFILGFKVILDRKNDFIVRCLFYIRLGRG